MPSRLFPFGHATHPQWRMACALVLAQVRAQMALPTYADAPTLGLLYITNAYQPYAQELLDHLSAELPGVTDWAGTTGVGIVTNNAEYWDEPALALMLCAIPAERYRVFSGVAPLGAVGGRAFEAYSALVHADPSLPDIADLVDELAQRTRSGYLFGGLASGLSPSVQFAVAGNGNIKGQGRAGGVFHGGLSGVALSAEVGLVSRISQGCAPVSAPRTITASDGNLVIELDGLPALDLLLQDLGVSMEQPRAALAKMRTTLVGLSDATADSSQRSGLLGPEVRVRGLLGLDPQRRGVALTVAAPQGMRLSFCQRNAEVARHDLVRMCAEIRDELEPESMALETALALQSTELDAGTHPARSIAGAVYISCSGRGGAYFGGPSAEMQIVRRALGDVPLVGFFAAGEIAKHHLFSYTSVLSAFTTAD